jgi:protein SCO1
MAPSRRSTAAVGLSLAALLVLLAYGGWTTWRRSDARESPGLERAAEDDWTGPRLADFRMREAGGREVSLSDLAGEPFVLDFVFTTCTGPCPVMTGSMRRLQDDLAGSSVRLVSVSVDPENDTLERLAEYAAAHDADPARWLFLRGEEAEVDALAASVSLAAQRNPGADLGMQVAHSTRFLVVDGAGFVRGYYDGTTPEGRARAAARALWLAR